MFKRKEVNPLTTQSKQLYRSAPPSSLFITQLHLLHNKIDPNYTIIQIKIKRVEITYNPFYPISEGERVRIRISSIAPFKPNKNKEITRGIIQTYIYIYI